MNFILEVPLPTVFKSSGFLSHILPTRCSFHPEELTRKILHLLVPSSASRCTALKPARCSFAYHPLLLVCFLFRSTWFSTSPSSSQSWGDPIPHRYNRAPYVHNCCVQEQDRRSRRDVRGRRRSTTVCDANRRNVRLPAVWKSASGTMTDGQVGPQRREVGCGEGCGMIAEMCQVCRVCFCWCC